MSIRAKILIILFLGLFVGLSVSVMAYNNAHQLDRAVDDILNEDMASIRVLSEAREDLRQARRYEEQMVLWLDPDQSIEAIKYIDNLADGLEDNHVLSNRVMGLQRFQSIRDAYTGYREALREMASTMQKGSASRAEQAQELLAEINQVKVRIEAVILLLRQRGDATRSSRETLEQSISALQRFALAFPSLSTNPGRSEREIEQLRRRFGFVNGRIRDVKTNLKAIEGLEEAQESLRTIEQDLNALDEQLLTLGVSLVSTAQLLEEKRQQTLNYNNRLESHFVTLLRATWSALEQRKSAISHQRSSAFFYILAFLVGGTSLILLFAAVLIRRMTGNFTKLADAARRIQRGDLGTRVHVETNDELREVGRAFNAMASYLEEHRHQQIHYNEIVSLLNSTLSESEILDDSLSAIVERSNSSLGAFYSADESGASLVLKGSFGLSERSLARKNYKLGVGLVGQAAKTRRKILLNEVPQGAFELDSGVLSLTPQALLVLPVVHVDHLLGVFVLASSRPYEEETLTFIEEIVFQFGVALNNVHFVETIEATASELRQRTEELIGQRARLEKVNRELEDANRLKSEFLANVTHELRTPLNSIIGFTELIREREAITEKKSKRHLETVQRNAENLLGLINDLLDITKIEAGKVALSLATFNASKIIEDCLFTVSPLVDSQKVKLKAEIAPALDQVFTDIGKLKQIIINLLSNAAKFTEKGSIVVKGEALDDGWAEFSIVDTGIGIHAEDLPLVFDKFRQVDGSSSRKYGGTGLGLSITAELVRLLGGEISVTSEPKQGSSFVVRLPIVRQTLEQAVQHNQQLEVTIEAPQRQQQKKAKRPLRSSVIIPKITPQSEPNRTHLIVIDDSPESVIRLREGLRNEDYEIKSAFVCRDAVELIRKHPPAAVILGNSLPEEGAEQAREEFAKLAKEMAFPILSLGQSRQAAEAEGIAFDRELERPIDPKAVLEFLSR